LGKRKKFSRRGAEARGRRGTQGNKRKKRNVENGKGM